MKVLDSVQISLGDNQRVSITQTDPKGVVISQVSVPRLEWGELMAQTMGQTKTATYPELMELITALRVLLENS